MDTFVWNPCFVTGIAVVDEQHHRLVDITNQLGDIRQSGADLSEGRMSILFKQLSDYAREHFRDEEALMRTSGIDARHVEAHAHHHHLFVEQLAAMWRARGSMEHPVETIHGFLSAWLAFHILVEDQSMARQVAAVAAGADVESAALTGVALSPAALVE